MFARLFRVGVTPREPCGVTVCKQRLSVRLSSLRRQGSTANPMDSSLRWNDEWVFLDSNLCWNDQWVFHGFLPALE
ncbi:MAG: hypothetical protein ACPF9K_07135 [Neptuniibacter sp.]